MKKLIYSGLMILYFLVFLPEASGENSGLRGEDNRTGRGSVLVVYYSRTGYTKIAAEAIADRFGAPTERLIDKKDRIGPIASTIAGKDAIAGNLTELDPLSLSPEDYETIIIGTPGWFGNMAPAVRTFVARYDLSGKAIGLFGTVNLTGIESALKQLGLLLSPEGSLKFVTLPLRHRDLKKGILSEKVDEFYQKLSSVRNTDR